MKRFSEQFKKEAERTGLRAAEARELKERVVAYMEYHPLPAEMQIERKGIAFDDPFTVIKLPLWQLRGAFMMSVFIAMIIVPFAAEKSLPGDVLYPVKIRFNEEVRSSLSFSSYEKVEWETKKLERRLAEVRLLAGEGKLTEEVEAAAAVAVAEHTAAAQRELALLRESDGEEAALAEFAFATTLGVQADALASTLSRTSTTVGETNDVSEALTSAKARVEQTDQPPSFERLLALVEQKTTEAQELFLSLKPVAGDVIKRDVERRMQDIERKRQLAITRNTEPVVEESSVDENLAVAAAVTMDVPTSRSYDPGAARGILKDVLQSTEKMILFMSDIELSTRVTVEDLVPATPTDDELNNDLIKLNQSLETQLKALKARVGNTPSEKVLFGLTQIGEMKNTADAAAAAGEYSAAISQINSAVNMAGDLLRALDTPGRPTDTNVEQPVATSTATSTPTLTQ